MPMKLLSLAGCAGWGVWAFSLVLVLLIASPSFAQVFAATHTIHNAPGVGNPIPAADALRPTRSDPSGPEPSSDGVTVGDSPCFRKVVLVGDPHTGKSEMRKYLGSQPVHVSLQQENVATEGLETLFVPGPSATGSPESSASTNRTLFPCYMQVYDFGGQEEYDYLHAGLFDPQSVYIVLWDVRHILHLPAHVVALRLQHWLRAIQLSHGPHRRDDGGETTELTNVVVVGNFGNNVSDSARRTNDFTAAIEMVVGSSNASQSTSFAQLSLTWLVVDIVAMQTGTLKRFQFSNATTISQNSEDLKRALLTGARRQFQDPKVASGLARVAGSSLIHEKTIWALDAYLDVLAGTVGPAGRQDCASSRCWIDDLASLSATLEQLKYYGLLVTVPFAANVNLVEADQTKELDKVLTSVHVTHAPSIIGRVFHHLGKGRHKLPFSGLVPKDHLLRALERRELSTLVVQSTMSPGAWLNLAVSARICMEATEDRYLCPSLAPFWYPQQLLNQLSPMRMHSGSRHPAWRLALICQGATHTSAGQSIGASLLWAVTLLQAADGQSMFNWTQTLVWRYGVMLFEVDSPTYVTLQREYASDAFNVEITFARGQATGGDETDWPRSFVFIHKQFNCSKLTVNERIDQRERVPEPLAANAAGPQDVANIQPHKATPSVFESVARLRSRVPYLSLTGRSRLHNSYDIFIRIWEEPAVSGTIDLVFLQQQRLLTRSSFYERWPGASRNAFVLKLPAVTKLPENLLNNIFQATKNDETRLVELSLHPSLVADHNRKFVSTKIAELFDDFNIGLSNPAIVFVTEQSYMPLSLLTQRCMSCYSETLGAPMYSTYSRKVDATVGLDDWDYRICGICALWNATTVGIVVVQQPPPMPATALERAATRYLSKPSEWTFSIIFALAFVLVSRQGPPSREEAEAESTWPTRDSKRAPVTIVRMLTLFLEKVPLTAVSRYLLSVFGLVVVQIAAQENDFVWTAQQFASTTWNYTLATSSSGPGGASDTSPWSSIESNFGSGLLSGLCCIYRLALIFAYTIQTVRERYVRRPLPPPGSRKMPAWMPAWIPGWMWAWIWPLPEMTFWLVFVLLHGLHTVDVIAYYKWFGRYEPPLTYPRLVLAEALRNVADNGVQLYGLANERKLSIFIVIACILTAVVVGFRKSLPSHVKFLAVALHAVVLFTDPPNRMHLEAYACVMLLWFIKLDRPDDPNAVWIHLDLDGKAKYTAIAENYHLEFSIKAANGLVEALDGAVQSASLARTMAQSQAATAASAAEDVDAAAKKALALGKLTHDNANLAISAKMANITACDAADLSATAIRLAQSALSLAKVHKKNAEFYSEVASAYLVTGAAYSLMSSVSATVSVEAVRARAADVQESIKMAVTASQAASYAARAARLYKSVYNRQTTVTSSNDPNELLKKALAELATVDRKRLSKLQTTTLAEVIENSCGSSPLRPSLNVASWVVAGCAILFLSTAFARSACYNSLDEPAEINLRDHHLADMSAFFQHRLSVLCPETGCCAASFSGLTNTSRCFERELDYKDLTLILSLANIDAHSVRD